MLASTALVAGCGGGGKDSEKEASVSAKQALREIEAARVGLGSALDSYRAGNAKRADTQVGDAYLQHFELVEGPLETRDPELKESLEDGIREELRGKIKAGAPKAEVARLVTTIRRDLDKAEAALR